MLSLIAIEQTGSFSKAAEHLQVTQSAISQSMKNLETKLGFSLIIRDKKEIQLTPEGHKICLLGKRYLHNFDDLIQSFYKSRDQLVGDYAIGTLDGIGKSFMSEHVLKFLKKYSEISLQVVLETPENLLDRLKKQSLQAVILPEHYIPASLESHRLFDEYLCLVVHPDLLGGVKPDELTIEQIKNLPFIFFDEQDPNFYLWSRDRYKQVPKGIKPRLVFNSYTPMLHAVKDKIGAAIMPTHILARPYFMSQTTDLVTSKEVFLSRICLAFSSDLADDIKTKHLLEYLTTHS